MLLFRLAFSITSAQTVLRCINLETRCKNTAINIDVWDKNNNTVLQLQYHGKKDFANFIPWETQSHPKPWEQVTSPASYGGKTYQQLLQIKKIKVTQHVVYRKNNLSLKRKQTNILQHTCTKTCISQPSITKERNWQVEVQGKLQNNTGLYINDTKTMSLPVMHFFSLK